MPLVHPLHLNNSQQANIIQEYITSEDGLYLYKKLGSKQDGSLPFEFELSNFLSRAADRAASVFFFIDGLYILFFSKSPSMYRQNSKMQMHAGSYGKYHIV